ncbi:helix-turn-helix transcriptional regulator [Vibrio chagasii]|uniref:helix-turn-helix transcriptional regulator n=1 Tax=Vibrio chagasii TaxID=170679 RepID=UPI003DA1C293
MGLNIPLIDKRIAIHFQQALQEDNSFGFKQGVLDELAAKANLPFSMSTSSATYIPFNVFALFLHELRLNLSADSFTSLLLKSAQQIGQEVWFGELSIDSFLRCFSIDELTINEDKLGFSVSLKSPTPTLKHVESELLLIIYVHAYLKTRYPELSDPIRYDLVANSAEDLRELQVQSDTPQYLGQEHTRIHYSSLDSISLSPAKPEPMADSDRVSHALSSYIGRMDIDLDKFCDLNGIGKRTVQRALKDEQTTFKAIKESLSFEFAKRVLSQQGYAISDVALHLGYADSSQFIRSFKRANGITPYQWKKLN